MDAIIKHSYGNVELYCERLRSISFVFHSFIRLPALASLSVQYAPS